MITEFKTKEQIEAEELNEIREKYIKVFSEKEADRAMRIFHGKPQDDDRLFLSNRFIDIKLKLKQAYKYLDIVYDLRKLLPEDKEEELLGFISEYESYINDCAKSLVDLLIPQIDKYFSADEIVQLISGNYEEVKRIKEWYSKEKTGTPSVATSYIIHHAEYRWRKGRCKDFVDCPRWEMPLFNCISDYMLEEIRKVPKFHNEMLQFEENLFGEAMIYSDTGEKVIRVMPVREIIKKFKGNFIKELKLNKEIDLEKEYRVKSFNNGSYAIVSDEGEILHQLYIK